MRRSFTILGVIVLGTLFWTGDRFALVSAAQATTDFSRAAATPTPTPSPTTGPAASPTPPKFDDPNEVIRVEAQLVNINVRVIDRNNRPINDITKKDIKVFEDGVQQPIEFFSQSEVPTNYTLVLDNSGSMRSQLEKVIEAGKILVNTNHPNDDTSVIRFVGRDKIRIEQDFTSNKADLVDALDNLYIEGGQTAIRDAVYLATESVEEHDKSKKMEDRRRRAIVLVTDGEDRDSYYSDQQLFDLLREAETQIYVIGFVTELSNEGGFITKSPQGKAKIFLQRLATETGGKVYFPSSTNELPSIAKDIANELRTQISIGYMPTNDAHDGTFRTIKVVVDDGPNSQKRIAIARPGRTAEGGSPTPQKPKQAVAKPQN